MKMETYIGENPTKDMAILKRALGIAVGRITDTTKPLNWVLDEILAQAHKEVDEEIQQGKCFYLAQNHN